eukprot:Opistho-1_new@86811
MRVRRGKGADRKNAKRRRMLCVRDVRLLHLLRKRRRRRRRDAHLQHRVRRKHGRHGGHVLLHLQLLVHGSRAGEQRRPSERGSTPHGCRRDVLVKRGGRRRRERPVHRLRPHGRHLRDGRSLLADRREGEVPAVALGNLDGMARRRLLQRGRVRGDWRLRRWRRERRGRGRALLAVELVAVLIVQRLAHREAKVDEAQKFELEDVHLGRRNAPDLGVKRVVVVAIVQVLGSEHRARDQEAVNVVRRNDKLWVHLHDAVNVDEGNDEALGAARRKIDNAVEIALNADARDLRGIEPSERAMLLRLGAADHFVENRRDDGDNKIALVRGRRLSWRGECRLNHFCRRAKEL